MRYLNFDIQLKYYYYEELFPIAVIIILWTCNRLSSEYFKYFFTAKRSRKFNEKDEKLKRLTSRYIYIIASLKSSRCTIIPNMDILTFPCLALGFGGSAPGRR